MNRTSLNTPSSRSFRPATSTDSPPRSSGSPDATEKVNTGTPDFKLAAEPDIGEIVRLRDAMITAGDVVNLRENLSQFPEVSVNLNLSNWIGTVLFDVLMAAWPGEGQPSPMLHLANAPAAGANPGLLARVFTDPRITRLELVGVPIDAVASQAIATAIARDGTRLRELICRQSLNCMLDPGLAHLLPLLTRLDCLNLQLISSPADVMPGGHPCEPLMMALLNKPLQQLCLVGFQATLWHMLPYWDTSMLRPRWESVSVEGHNLGFNSQSEVTVWSFNGFTGFVHHIICMSEASRLTLRNISCSTQLPWLAGSTPQDPGARCFANLRTVLLSALEDRSRQPGTEPLGISIEMNDLDVLRVLLPAIAAPSVRGVESIELNMVHYPYAPLDAPPPQVQAQEFLNIVTRHAGHLQHTDDLSLGLNLPGSAAHPGARQSINALSQALSGLHLTSLDFTGTWFDELPEALLSCMHAAAIRSMHMHLQRQALGSCIRFGGPAYAQLGEVGGEVLGQLEHPDRLLPVLPALDSAHLKAFVDRYEARREQRTRLDDSLMPGPHPLKAVSDSVQQRLKGGA